MGYPEPPFGHHDRRLEDFLLACVFFSPLAGREGMVDTRFHHESQELRQFCISKPPSSFYSIQDPLKLDGAAYMQDGAFSP